MPSFLTRRKFAGPDMRNLHPRTELPFLFAYSVFYIALSACTGLLILHRPLDIFGTHEFLLDAWYFLVFKLGFLLLTPALIFWRLGYGIRDLAPRGITSRDFLWCIPAYAIGAAINANRFSEIGQQVHLGRMNFIWARIAGGLLIALFNAGIPEEFFFRGWLQTRIDQRFGRPLAILGTAILFTAWHIPSRYFLAFGAEGHAGSLGSVLLHTGLPVFIVALILGVLWDRYRRLLPLIALHWGVDTLPLISGMLGILR